MSQHHSRRGPGSAISLPASLSANSNGATRKSNSSGLSSISSNLPIPRVPAGRPRVNAEKARSGLPPPLKGFGKNSDESRNPNRLLAPSAYVTSNSDVPSGSWLGRQSKGSSYQGTGNVGGLAAAEHTTSLNLKLKSGNAARNDQVSPVPVPPVPSYPTPQDASDSSESQAAELSSESEPESSDRMCSESEAASSLEIPTVNDPWGSLSSFPCKECRCHYLHGAEEDSTALSDVAGGQKGFRKMLDLMIRADSLTGLNNDLESTVTQQGAFIMQLQTHIARLESQLRSNGLQVPELTAGGATAMGVIDAEITESLVQNGARMTSRRSSLGELWTGDPGSVADQVLPKAFYEPVSDDRIQDHEVLLLRMCDRTQKMLYEGQKALNAKRHELTEDDLDSQAHVSRAASLVESEPTLAARPECPTPCLQPEPLSPCKSWPDMTQVNTQVAASGEIANAEAHLFGAQIASPDFDPNELVLRPNELVLRGIVKALSRQLKQLELLLPQRRIASQRRGSVSSDSAPRPSVAAHLQVERTASVSPQRSITLCPRAGLGVVLDLQKEAEARRSSEGRCILSEFKSTLAALLQATGVPLKLLAEEVQGDSFDPPPVKGLSASFVWSQHALIPSQENSGSNFAASDMTLDLRSDASSTRSNCSGFSCHSDSSQMNVGPSFMPLQRSLRRHHDLVSFTPPPSGAPLTPKTFVAQSFAGSHPATTSGEFGYSRSNGSFSDQRAPPSVLSEASNGTSALDKNAPTIFTPPKVTRAGVSSVVSDTGLLRGRSAFTNMGYGAGTTPSLLSMGRAVRVKRMPIAVSSESLSLDSLPDLSVPASPSPTPSPPTVISPPFGDQEPSPRAVKVRAWSNGS